MVALYEVPLGMSVKKEVASLSHLPKIAIKYQKWKRCDYIRGTTA